MLEYINMDTLKYIIFVLAALSSFGALGIALSTFYRNTIRRNILRRAQMTGWKDNTSLNIIAIMLTTIIAIGFPTILVVSSNAQIADLSLLMISNIFFGTWIFGVMLSKNNAGHIKSMLYFISSMLIPIPLFYLFRINNGYIWVYYSLLIVATINILSYIIIRDIRNDHLR